MAFVTVKMTGYKEACDRLNPKRPQQAAKFALTTTKDRTVVEGGRLIRGKYNISLTDLLNKSSGKPRIQSSGRVGDDLTAVISFRAGGISLVYFGAVEYRRTSAGMTKRGRKGITSIKRGKVGVKVQIEKGKTTQLRQFFAGVKYGKGAATGTHLGVFRRVGKERFPIAESAVISPATMLGKPDILKPLTQFVQTTFTNRFNHEMKRLGVTQ